eukprot:TRINITY_DN4291_c1_g1_i2.p1 TRINITY_DN4291_c1_g1~~TRINITY_DN4291_c1_g1_i2.p1  ORF type:complete len:246 (-),score=81.18 TRINITY_DN4291_c1_g1_i2:4-741(-)
MYENSITIVSSNTNNNNNNNLQNNKAKEIIEALQKRKKIENFPSVIFTNTTGPTINLYNLDNNYTFEIKEAQSEKDNSATARFNRMKEKYEREDMRRSVEAVLLVQKYNHPHIVLLQTGTAYFRLPGGRLQPGEGEIEGLTRKLTKKLAHPNFPIQWEIKDLLCVWYRPHFDNHLFPYIPPHITKPKECKKIFIVALPEKYAFAYPKNIKVTQIPIIDLYDNASQYGPIIANIPQLLGRFNFVYV